jgi:hypothetical protein
MKKISISLLILLSVISSCTDLEIAPNSKLTEASAYKTKGEFLNGLSGIYGNLDVWLECVYKFGSTSDEMIFPARGSDWKGDLQSMHSQTWTKQNGEIKERYIGMSKLIANANSFIDIIDNSSFKDDSDIKIIRGETRFLRAFGYFLMIDNFGNVPLITTASYDPNNLPKQSSRAEVFKFIESELKDLAVILPENSVYGRVNKYTAKALLAKLYLNAEVYLGTGNTKWAEVASLTSEIIGKQYVLEANYKDVFKWNNDVTSKESLFVVVCDSYKTKTQNMTLRFSLTNLTEKYGSAANGWGGCAALPTFYKSFEPNDIRLNAFLAGPQVGATGLPIMQIDPEGDPNTKVQLNYAVDFLSSNPVNNARHWDGARGVKYAMDGVGGDISYYINNDIPIIRYADVILMKAEALHRQTPGSPEALALVNQIRKRANVAPFVTLTNDNLLAERGREFAWEGWRRNDLIRFGKFTNAWDYKPASESFRNLFPIPQEQIDANPNLKQNPGYN